MGGSRFSIELCLVEGGVAAEGGGCADRGEEGGA